MDNKFYEFVLVVFILFALCVNCACEGCEKAVADTSGVGSGSSALTSDRPSPGTRDLPRAPRSSQAFSPVANGPRLPPPSLRDPILVECLDAHRCPGPNAVFVGARVGWIVRSAFDRGGPSPSGAFEVAEDRPAGVVSLSSRRDDERGEVVELQAKKPGVATIVFRYRSLGRDFTSTRQLRVVAVEDAVRGEVRMRAGQKGENGRFTADADLVGPALPESIAVESPQLVVTWLLADGTRAVGGAGRVDSSEAEGRVHALGKRAAGRDGDDLERTLLRFFGAPGTVTLSATLGQAQLDQSFVYDFRSAALRPCTPGDTSDFLAAADAGYEGAWPTETSGLLAKAGQDVLFPVDRNLPDVTVEQVCGPTRVVPFPQAEDFAARFTTPGWYQFVLKDSDGELLQAGAYGERVTNPYTVGAAR
ncbi:MAG TPA: hypothetical protein VGK67_02570 [Myxococcales bacterium]|jgi:hypothetical protein